jgi:uncharacterized protein YaaR (DUF327 family)
LKEIVSHAQSTPEYNESINTLIAIGKKYLHKAQASVEEAKEKTDVSVDEDRVLQAGNDLKTFAERLAGKSLDGVKESGETVVEHIKNDPKLEAYFQAVEEFVERCLHDGQCESFERPYTGQGNVETDKSLSLDRDQTSLPNELTERLLPCTTTVNLSSSPTLPGRRTPTSSKRRLNPSSTLSVTTRLPENSSTPLRTWERTSTRVERSDGEV